MIGLNLKSLARTSVIAAAEQNQRENDNHIAMSLGSGFDLTPGDGEPIDAGLCGISRSVRRYPERRDRACCSVDDRFV